MLLAKEYLIQPRGRSPDEGYLTALMQAVMWEMQSWWARNSFTGSICRNHDDSPRNRVTDGKRGGCLNRALVVGTSKMS